MPKTTMSMHTPRLAHDMLAENNYSDHIESYTGSATNSSLTLEITH